MKKIIAFSLFLFSCITIQNMDYDYNPINHSTIRLIDKNNKQEIDQITTLLQNQPFNYTKADIENKINNPYFVSPNSKTPGSQDFLIHVYTRNPSEITGVIEYIAWKKGIKTKPQITIEAIITSEKHRRQNIASQLIAHIERSYGFDHHYMWFHCNDNDKITQNFLKKNRFQLNKQEELDASFIKFLKKSKTIA
ncbi:MAG: GNAT family N-acetyltransferase [Candidatus Chromulinivorax sp.]